MGSRLLVINSGPAIRRMVSKAAGGLGYEVTTFNDAPSALEEAQRAKPDMIIADYQIDGLTCVAFCDKLKEMGILPDAALGLLVNPSDGYDESDLRSRGVKAFLPKPFRPEQIDRLIEELRGKEAEVNQPLRPRQSWPPDSTAASAEGESAPTVRLRKPWPPETSKPGGEDDASAVAGTTTEREATSPSLASSQAPSHSPLTITTVSATASPGTTASAGTTVSAAAAAEPLNPVMEEPEQTPTLKLSPGPVTDATPATTPSGVPRELEEAIGHVVTVLGRSLLGEGPHEERSHEGMAQTMSQVDSQQVGSQLVGMVQAEVSAQIAAAMSGEAMLHAIQEAFQQQLPAITARLTSSLEPALRQEFAEKAGQAVEDIAGTAAERIAREVAEQKVGAVVSTAVPEMAEAQIKKEIERLTAAP